MCNLMQMHSRITNLNVMQYACVTAIAIEHQHLVKSYLESNVMQVICNAVKQLQMANSKCNLQSK